MSSWFSRAFGYGLGRAAGKAIFGADEPKREGAPAGPVQARTEAEILADEKRFDEDEKRLDEADEAARPS